MCNALDPSAGNTNGDWYVYDNIGQIVEDHSNSEIIQYIDWTSFHKPRTVRIEDRNTGDMIRVINYKYDAQGNRIAKEVSDESPVLTDTISFNILLQNSILSAFIYNQTEISTWPRKTSIYSRDAQGNPLAINMLSQPEVERNTERLLVLWLPGFNIFAIPLTDVFEPRAPEFESYKQSEVIVYGSQRLGVDKTGVDYTITNAPVVKMHEKPQLCRMTRMCSTTQSKWGGLLSLMMMLVAPGVFAGRAPTQPAPSPPPPSATQTAIRTVSTPASAQVRAMPPPETQTRSASPTAAPQGGGSATPKRRRRGGVFSGWFGRHATHAGKASAQFGGERVTLYLIIALTVILVIAWPLGIFPDLLMFIFAGALVVALILWLIGLI